MILEDYKSGLNCNLLKQFKAGKISILEVDVPFSDYVFEIARNNEIEMMIGCLQDSLIEIFV
jgi:hypothetical protein